MGDGECWLIAGSRQGAYFRESAGGGNRVLVFLMMCLSMLYRKTRFGGIGIGMGGSFEICGREFSQSTFNMC